ncbi:hypothetical protein HY772_07920 [Candidatus Woesearchaeota archaeon]|nr:hypothetical protein [Candidatus Woesearchaeota archaeon]
MPFIRVNEFSGKPHCSSYQRICPFASIRSAAASRALCNTAYWSAANRTAFSQERFSFEPATQHPQN